MSNKSGVAGHVVSLPQGGGAIKGLGERFAPDLHSGTGNLSIPIALPSGRNGFQPQLALTYSTGQGNGPFGLGWSLGVPAIARRTAKGVPRYGDDDVFVLSGAEDLVPLGPATGGRQMFRPRIEGLFARIERVRDAAHDHWEVRTKDGLISEYGTASVAGGDPATMADPADRRRIFSWRLTRTRDPFGNEIRYRYRREAGVEGLRRWDQLYLAGIDYVDFERAGARDFLVSFDVEYEPRPDPVSEHRSGFEIRTALRATRLLVRSRADRERFVRAYELAYAPPERTPVNGVSLLESISLVGFDDAGAVSDGLPPLTFSYTGFAPDARHDLIAVTGDDLPPGSLGRPEYELADLTGDGLPDVLEMNGAVRYWRNLGGGRFDRPRTMVDAPAGLALADPGVQLLDADGDGRIDLMVHSGTLSGTFPLSADGTWDRRSFRPSRFAPSFSLEDPDVRLLDLDGDGITDALRAGTRLECFFHRPRTGWSPDEVVFAPRRQLEEFPDVSFSDPRVKLADLSGDGLQDIVLVHDGNVEYWPSLGWGAWGPRVSMRRSPRLPLDHDPRRVLLGDVDGDGLADLIYVDDRAITLWINRGGESWSDPIVIRGTPPVTDADAVRLVDFMGTGVSGVLWTADAAGDSRPHMFFLDLTGGGKPYLLDEIDNHLGALTRVTYTTSTAFMTADATHRSTRWRTTLPFPVQVVSGVEIVDAISRTRLTSRYHYRHGYWDGEEREFRGFGRVEQLDTESALEQAAAGAAAPFDPVDAAQFAPPTLTRTWFHPGPVGPGDGDWREVGFADEYWAGDPAWSDPQTDTAEAIALDRRARRDAVRSLRGLVLRTEIYSRDDSPLSDRPFTVTDAAYAVRVVQPPGPAGQPGVFFPRRIAERVTQWERGDDPLTRVTFTGDYDAFGQPREVTNVALPRRARHRRAVPSTRGDVRPDETRLLATHVRTVYASPAGAAYLHDRVAHIREFELAVAPLVNETAPDDLARVLIEHAAAARSVAGQFAAALATWRPGEVLPTAVHLTRHRVHRYDGAAFAGLDPGVAGVLGALTRTDDLVLTGTILGNTLGARTPDYLGGPAVQPAGAPGFTALALGYRREADTVHGYHDGFYAATLSQQYDFQTASPGISRGLVVAREDATGSRTHIEYDAFGLLPVRAVDPLGLESVAENDYRVFQPARAVDANGHATRVRYNGIGLPTHISREGRDGEGGTVDRPDVRHTYDLLAFDRTRGDSHPQPASVHTSRRVRHASETSSDETNDEREFSDGFGRIVQVRRSADRLRFGTAGDDVGLPADVGVRASDCLATLVHDSVVVSGWQLVDNKGQVVRKYEPFYSTGWEYQPGTDARRGVFTSTAYDARGRVCRTLAPDGSETRIVFGHVSVLDQPESATPTPWERATYDSNDNAGHAPATTTHVDPSHWNTPSNVVVDALGRVVCQVDRNGPVASTGWLVTQAAFDLRGNTRHIVDPFGRVAYAYGYDLLDRRLAARNMDAGLVTTLLDAAGRLVETADDRGALSTREYDAGGRLIAVRARDDGAAPLTVRERVRYGDEGPHAEARLANVLGRPVEHFDEAGVVRMLEYDFKGNVRAKVRHVVSDAALAAGWVTDWDAPGAAAALDPTGFRSDLQYDAFDRIVSIDAPGAAGARVRLESTRTRSGSLESVRVDGTPVVTRIAYNARGQRILMALGNGLVTRHAYDPRSLRPARTRTEVMAHSTSAAGETWRSVNPGAPLQDAGYHHDLAGNLVAIDDRTPHCGIAGSRDGRHRLRRAFTYDPLYRLRSATGRACRDIGAPRSPVDPMRCGGFVRGTAAPAPSAAPDLVEPYSESYRYDDAGNLLALTYAAATAAWTREFGHGGLAPGADPASASANGLTRMRAEGNTLSFTLDAAGNLQTENIDRACAWDHANRLRRFTVQAPGSGPASIDARYLYGADGRRVKKWVRRGGVAQNDESTVYLDDHVECHRWRDGLSTREATQAHVMDDRARIALVRAGDRHPDDLGPRVEYHVADQVGSSQVVSGGDDATATVFLNREEYFPFGETSFGSFSRKRYRFAGKERDAESGFCYFGARYLAPAWGRWIGCDPAGPADGLGLYIFCRNSPVVWRDAEGRQSAPAAETPPADTPAIHLILVGTDAQEGSRWRHKRGDLTFALRVTTLLNERTMLENFPARVGPDDQIVVLVPPNVEKPALKELQTAGAAYGSHYSVVQVAEKDLEGALTGFRSHPIKSVFYFGHGSQSGPFYDWGSPGSLPEPSTLGLRFAPDAQAIFMTCSSRNYAEAFTAATGVTSIGTSGTSYWAGSMVHDGGQETKTTPRGAMFTFDPAAPGKPTEGTFHLNPKYGTPFMKPMPPEPLPPWALEFINQRFYSGQTP